MVATGSGGAISPVSAVKDGVPNFLDGTEPVKILKNAIWGEPLRNYIYIEVNDNDPRVALNWELESGEKFFDVVILFASNLRTRNCAAELAAGNRSHICTMNGPHIHHNGNVQHILSNRDKYIKPLQDAGIKVTMGLLGDHDPFIFYSLGSWPSNQSWQNYTGAVKNQYLTWWQGDPNEYPLGPAGREAFLSHLAEEIQKYGLDGFDIDDEWSSISVPQMNTDMRNRNNAEFIRIMRHKLGPNAIISVYQYGSLGGIGSGVFDQNAGTGLPESLVNINPNIWNYVTMSGYAMYGGFGSPYAGIPRSQYSPFALWVNNTNGSTNYAGYTNAVPKYGWMLFYDLGVRNQSRENFINRYAVNMYGQNVVYGGDGQLYPQDWPKWE